MINKYRNGSYSTFNIIAVTAIVVCLVLICLMGAAIYYLVNNQKPAQSAQNGAAPACPTCACSASQIMGAIVTATSPASPAAAPPAATAPADFKNIKSFNGSGSMTTEMFNLDTGTVKIKWKYAGGGDFILQLVKATDGTVEHIANVNGSNEDQKIFFLDKNNPYVIDVTSNGTWNITVDWMP